MNVSLNLFPDSAEENKALTTWSSVSGYASPIPSRQSNGLMHEQVEKGKKYENSVGCRLFGIDLTSNSNAAAPEKEPVHSTVDCSGTKVSVPATGEADRAQSMDVSMSSKEQKQVVPEALPKEMQSKQGSTASARTRTKVKFTVVADSLY